MERERKRKKNFDRRGLKTALVSLCLISHADGWRCFSSFPHSIMEGTRREEKKKKWNNTKNFGPASQRLSVFHTVDQTHTHKRRKSSFGAPGSRRRLLSDVSNKLTTSNRVALFSGVPAAQPAQRLLHVSIQCLFLFFPGGLLNISVGMDTNRTDLETHFRRSNIDLEQAAKGLWRTRENLDKTA